MSNKKQENETAPRYTKAQLISAQRYRDKKDILSALLNEGILYSFAEVDTITNNFLKGKVKTC